MALGQVAKKINSKAIVSHKRAEDRQTLSQLSDEETKIVLVWEIKRKVI